MLALFTTAITATTILTVHLLFLNPNWSLLSLSVLSRYPSSLVLNSLPIVFGLAGPSDLVPFLQSPHHYSLAIIHFFGKTPSLMHVAIVPIINSGLLLAMILSPDPGRHLCRITVVYWFNLKLIKLS